MEHIIYPTYYKKFRCLADKCRHTCCAGWEIDIDPESLKRFKRDGLAYISENGDPHFELQENERCPYLQENGLCCLIIEKGEDYLCDICADHPRFRNFWSGITEIGVGLSCEAAARLILSEKTPIQLVSDDDIPLQEAIEALPPDEQYLWQVREEIFAKAALLQDPLQARLMEYFAYRQIPDALYDDRLDGRIAFIEYSVREIFRNWKETTDGTLEALVETARRYSEETEYDTDRLDLILDRLNTES